MTNKQVADILDEIGTLLELQGENPFKCMAYHNASRALNALTTELSVLIQTGELKNVKGIGQSIAEKITELVGNERLEYYEKLKSSFPPGVITMLRVAGLGPKRVKLLYDKLKIKSIDELKDAAEKGRLESIEGFGKKSEENILQGIANLEKHANRFLYPDAREAADKIHAVIQKQKCVIRSEVAGSLRRRKEIIGDIDILASVKKNGAAELMDVFTSHPDVDQIVAKGDTKSSVILTSGINCDLRAVHDDEYAFALAYFTGSKDHNVAMRSLAKKHGWSLNEYGFSELGAEEKRGKAKRIVKCKDEEDIFKALDLQFIPPELRENTGEIDAALAGNITELVQEKDIRGTFHCHTTYSDGLSTLEQIVEAARALGWEYLGIADHSKAAAYAKGLTEAQVKQQIKEIDTLNSRLKNFRVFKGTEADILPDGSVDYGDKVLGEFDYVVASVHSKFKMTEAVMTKRIIKALKNKHVTMLGHPTGRLLLEREPYPVNMIDVINAAADYGKIIELNCHPSRFDLDWRLCKYAKEKGVKIAINPDAHNTNGLRDVFYGVGIARKGWLEKDDIMNTRSMREVVKLLNIKE